jgi:hypothetical protein
MAFKCIQKLEIKCDNCKKIIATGKTSSEFIKSAEEELRYTEIFCTDCVKLPLAQSSRDKN